MTPKQRALHAIHTLPDDASFETIAQTIEFVAAVQVGLDELDRGEGIPHEDVVREMKSWLTE